MESPIAVFLYCRLCKTDLPFDDFSPYQQTASYPKCRPCVKLQRSTWATNNRDSVNATARKWYHATKELRREKAQYNRTKWKHDNPDAYKLSQKQYRQALKDRIFTAYSKQCTCCLETNLKLLSIDHIDNDGAEHRKELGGKNFYTWLEKNNYPRGFQTLCYSCNIGKHQNGGICPHKEQTQMKHSDQETADEVHEIHHPVGHGLLDTRRDLHNRSPHAMNTPIVGQPPMDPTQGPQYA